MKLKTKDISFLQEWVDAVNCSIIEHNPYQRSKLDKVLNKAIKLTNQYENDNSYEFKLIYEVSNISSYYKICHSHRLFGKLVSVKCKVEKYLKDINNGQLLLF